MFKTGDKSTADEFFPVQNWQVPFLETEEGKEYLAPFKTLRINHILLRKDGLLLDTMDSDRIIPRDWLYNAYKENLRMTLEFDNNSDNG